MSNLIFLPSVVSQLKDQNEQLLRAVPVSLRNAEHQLAQALALIGSCADEDRKRDLLEQCTTLSRLIATAWTKVDEMASISGSPAASSGPPLARRS